MLRRALLSLVAVASLVAPVACISEDPGLPPPTCEAYCEVIQRTCTGTNAQYRDVPECLKTCALLTPGERTDVNGDTIGCRMRKAESAQTLAECNEAGPFGGPTCGNNRCVPFCTIVEKACLQKNLPNPPYASKGDCDEKCPTIPPGRAEEQLTPSGANGDDTLNCRARHLIIAISEPEVHCSHVAVDSPVCK